MFSLLEQAITKAIIYSDIFDYPLTLDEIKRWLIKINNKEQITKNKIKELKFILEKDGYYFLKDREKLIALRKERQKYSQEKFKIAREIINLLKLIPTIRLIGVTGALAMQNGKKEDDIDLFIIISSGLLWTTRLIATLFIEITGRRRHPQEKNVNNKICLNMFVDENHLEIPKEEQDLFSAHEVLQMKPLFDRAYTYKKFLSSNKWVRKYLPNAYKEITLTRSRKDTSDGGEATTSTPPRWRNQKRILGMLESLLKKFQLWYMRNHRTSEVIQEGIIRFHPQDAREWVLRRYKDMIRLMQ